MAAGSGDLPIPIRRHHQHRGVGRGAVRNQDPPARRPGGQMSAGVMNIHDAERKGEAGFTLVEALIGVGIFAIVLLSILQMFATNRVTYAKGEVKVPIQQNARAALELIPRELRMVGYDPNHTTPLLGAGTTPATTQRAIQSATATGIRFKIGRASCRER